jgi:hypothetical protein
MKKINDKLFQLQFKDKPPLTAEAKRCMTPVVRIHLFASYNHAGLNGSCNTDASTVEGNS